MRIERRLQFLERRDVRAAILVRHARSAVPSSAGYRLALLHVTLCRPTESHGATAVSHRMPPGRHSLPPLCQTQDEPVKTTKGRRMSTKIAVGGKAPGFKLAQDGGGEVSLADFKGRKLVVYFYPKADTSGCTVEAKDFSRLASAFSRAGTAILGVSADPVPKLDKFKAKYDLSIPLAS